MRAWYAPSIWLWVGLILGLLVWSPAWGSNFPGAVIHDFNTSLYGWTARNGNFIDATPASWGGVYEEYWSPDLGDGDRAITFYKSQVNDAVPWWRVSLTNTTGKTVHTLTVNYDIESPWSRYDAATVRDGAVRWFINPGSGLVAVSTSPTVSNAMVTTPVVWFDDAQMDALNLAKRDNTFTVTGLNIEPGAAFVLEIRSHVASGNRRRAIRRGGTGQCSGEVSVSTR